MSSPAPAPMAPEDEICQYRHRTRALLRRYFYTSVEVGRLPSLLGRELFRSKVTSYRMSSFEDAVIFVHDVERALEQLDDSGKIWSRWSFFRTTHRTKRRRCCSVRAVLCAGSFPKPWTKSASFFWKEVCSIVCLRGDLWKILVKGVKTPNSPQTYVKKPNKKL